MNKAKVFSLLSLCARAGKLTAGETVTERLLASGAARLVLIAGDASDNTRRKFINKCFYYKVPAAVYGERETLSRIVGKPNRTTFTVTDPNFAHQIQSYMSMEVDECQRSEYTN